MKATSIEQIREHLERGGRVMCHVREFPGIEAHCRSVVRSRTSGDGFVFDDGTWAQFDNSFVDHWELVPIDEEEADGEYDDSVELLLNKVNQWRECQPRIRTALLYGRRPEMSDLLEWWQEMTGERIEHGERCTVCECSGQTCTGRMTLGNPPKPQMQTCPACKGSGYSTKPTWMEVGK